MSLDKHVTAAQQQRDKMTRGIPELKEGQHRLEQELRDLLDDQELKYQELFQQEIPVEQESFLTGDIQFNGKMKSIFLFSIDSKISYSTYSAN